PIGLFRADLRTEMLSPGEDSGSGIVQIGSEGRPQLVNVLIPQVPDRAPSLVPSSEVVEHARRVRHVRQGAGWLELPTERFSLMLDPPRWSRILVRCRNSRTTNGKAKKRTSSHGVEIEIVPGILSHHVTAWMKALQAADPA